MLPDTSTTLAGEVAAKGDGWRLPEWFGYSRWLALVIVAFLVLGTIWVNAQQVRGRAKTSGQVVGFVGRMGSGKSYAAVRMALDRLERGVDVYSNFHIDVAGLNVKGRWYPFLGWDQLADIRDAVVIVDEAHLYAASHQHVNFPMLARWALAHGRKHGLDLYWLSQHEDRVNKTLRDLTNYIAVCESFFNGSLFKVTFYAPEDLRKPKKHTHRRWYRLDLTIANRYDTKATIEVDDYTLRGDRSGARLRQAQARHLAAEKGEATLRRRGSPLGSGAGGGDALRVAWESDVEDVPLPEAEG